MKLVQLYSSLVWRDICECRIGKDMEGIGLETSEGTITAFA